MAKHRLHRLVAAAAVAVAATLSPLAPRADAAAVGEIGCFISASHHVFLGREASGTEVVSWADAIGNGAPRSMLPEQLAGSDAWLGVVVDGLYRDALDRAPDAAGRAFWIGELRRGVFVNSLGSSIYGSQEFFGNAGSTSEGFVRELYRRVLHREADSAGVQHWSGQVRDGERGGVASAFFSSIESRTDRVFELYHSVLGREPDPAGTAYWTTRLLRENDVRLAINLASSDEFYNRSIVPGNGCALPPDWAPA